MEVTAYFGQSLNGTFFTNQLMIRTSDLSIL